MTAEEKKTIDMIRQLREAVENQSLPLEEFPIGELANLVDVTLGREFLGFTGGMKKNHFEPLVGGLLKAIQHSAEQGDIQGTAGALLLLEEQYFCFDRLLTAYRGQKFVEQYKKIAIVTGETYSKLQYYLHQHVRNPKKAVVNKEWSGKGVVYTTTNFSKSEIPQPEYININWDYICFTKDPQKWGTKEGVWEYRDFNVENCEDARMLYNMCMLMPHVLLPEYDYSIWVNPAYKIVGDLELFLESYGRNHSLLGFPSYVTDDIYEVMMTGLHSDEENIQMRKKHLQYEKEGYPCHHGMISSNIIVRRHRDEKMCRVMETWWDEAIQCGRLWNYGFNYAAWKHEFEFAICDAFVEMNSYFKNIVCDLEVKRDE